MAPPRPRIVRLSSRPSRILVIDAAGFLLGAVVLVAARFVPQLLSPLAFWLLAAALAAGFGIDLMLWVRRGVRAIELEGQTLILRRGRARAEQRIERADVRCVSTRRRWGGRSIEVKTRDRGHRRRTVLRDDAFDREEFSGLAELLERWNSHDGRPSGMVAP